jgi:hypothetical protein
MVVKMAGSLNRLMPAHSKNKRQFIGACKPGPIGRVRTSMALPDGEA